jgi:hypothetical protein
VASCPGCGAAVAEGSRFCPQCGTRLDGEAPTDTAVLDVPPHETGPVPVHHERVRPQLFGVAPATALLVVGAAALVVALVVIALGRLLAGGLLLGAAVVLLVAFLDVARRKPDAPVAKASADAAGAVRARAGFAASSAATALGARRDQRRLRAELARLGEERARLYMWLGAAVHGGDEAGAAAARARLQELDRQAAERQAQLAGVPSEAAERVARERLAVQPTQVVPAATNGPAQPGPP